MINYILRTDEGYAPGDTEILRFMLSEPPKKAKETIDKSPQRKSRLWMVLLPKTEGRPQFGTIVLQWDCSTPVLKYDSKSSLKGLAFIRHQIMAPLDPNEASTGDLADNRRDQRIRFCDAVVKRTSALATEFAMDKRWRSCFLGRNELGVRQQIQNSSQFQSLKQVGDALASNLEKFSGGNTATPSLIVVFDKATNLFTPGIADSGTADLDTGRYVALNSVLSCLKELPAWFFMLSTESRLEKLLPPDIPAKEAEKENDNLWSSPSGRLPPANTGDLIGGLE